MPLYACNGCVKDLFVTDEELIERFTGKQLLMWGFTTRLDNTAVINRSSPVQSASATTSWKSTSTSGNSIAALKTDGSLWVWGNNFNGLIGDGTVINKSSPVQTVSAVTTWRGVSLSEYSTVAVKTDGTLWTWGGNNYGLIGNNTAFPAGNRSSPIQTVSAGTNWKSVSAAGTTIAAVKTDGSLWLWGRGDNGQLGNDSILHRSSPVQTVSNVTTWKQVSLGGSVSSAIKTDGTLWLWGQNPNGQLGTNDITSRSSPVQTVSGGTNWKQASAGTFNAGAVKTDGSLWLWGRNGTGQLGTNNITIEASSPVQTVSAGTNWRSVTVETNYSTNTTRSTAGIKTDGSLWVWGSNTRGRLGTGTSIAVSSPVQTISGGTGWRQTVRNQSLSVALCNVE